MSKASIKKILFGACFLSVLLLGGLWLKRKTIAPRMSFALAPLTSLDDNKQVAIEDFSGNVVIVSCFQTWCRDCAQETPILNELAARLAGEPFRVVYITDERTDKLRQFRSRLASQRILFTISATKLKDFGVHVYPTTYLLNKEGEVVLTKLEGYDWLKEEGRIRELLND